MKAQIAIAELPVLDYLIAKAQGRLPARIVTWEQTWPRYCSDPLLAMQIVFAEGINLRVYYEDGVMGSGQDMRAIGWKANIWNNSIPGSSGFMQWAQDRDPLVAAMRVKAMSVYGKEVEVPDGLITTISCEVEAKAKGKRVHWAEIDPAEDRSQSADEPPALSPLRPGGG